MRDHIEAIRINDGNLEEDDLVANEPRLLVLLRDHAIGEIEGVLHRRHFAGVQPGVDPNDGAARARQRLCFRGGGAAQCQRAADLFPPIEILQIVGRRNIGHQHGLAAGAPAEFFQPQTIADRGQLAKIAGDVGVVGQLVVVAGRVAQMLFRRWHTGGGSKRGEDE